jgi:CRP/FNR family transcriptional regulator, cyclic AMP receptor protein
LSELGTVIGPGNVIGELGIISAQNRRTQTVECIENGQALTIGYDQVRQLYFQNPKFGFYLLRLIGERLTRDIARLETANL